MERTKPKLKSLIKT